ncbi:MAG: branched-chain amino acid ABC transporter permease [Nitriliruptoraceae bacterium]
MGLDIVRAISDGLNAALGPTAAFYALAAIGLNVHYGYTGLLNFGQVGFMLVGGYGFAISVSVFGLPFIVGLIVGLLMAVLLALLLGIPTLRLRADYLAIATIAAAEILRFVVRSQPLTPLTGGPFDLPGGRSGWMSTFNTFNPFPPGLHRFGPLSFTGQRLWQMIIGWMLVALCVWLVWALMRSPWGRVIKSTREDEDAVRALGKNVFGYKMQSLILGGVIGGIAGIMMALTFGSVSTDAFQPQVTFFAYTILLLGGAATVFGPVVGSLIFWFVLQSIESVLRQTQLVEAVNIGALRITLVGVTLMALMIYRPQGLLGNRREMMLNA